MWQFPIMTWHKGRWQYMMTKIDVYYLRLSLKHLKTLASRLQNVEYKCSNLMTAEAALLISCNIISILTVSARAVIPTFTLTPNTNTLIPHQFPGAYNNWQHNNSWQFPSPRSPKSKSISAQSKASHSVQSPYWQLWLSCCCSILDQYIRFKHQRSPTDFAGIHFLFTLIKNFLQISYLII